MFCNDSDIPDAPDKWMDSIRHPSLLQGDGLLDSQGFSLGGSGFVMGTNHAVRMFFEFRRDEGGPVIPQLENENWKYHGLIPYPHEAISYMQVLFDDDLDISTEPVFTYDIPLVNSGLLDDNGLSIEYFYTLIPKTEINKLTADTWYMARLIAPETDFLYSQCPFYNTGGI